MEVKENPGFWTEDLFEGCFAATGGESPTNPKRSSRNGSQIPKKVPRAGTKTRTLLDTLRNHADAEVSLARLGKATELAAVHSSISTLRAGGWTIKNRMEHHPFQGGTSKHSFYKLEEES